MKAKAKAKAPKVKLAPKVKAPPGRGAPVVGKAKAIAAKSFAKVAAKAKTEGSAKGSGTWYFMSDLRKTSSGAYDEKAWRKFDAKSNKALEQAFSKGQKQYTIAFKGNSYIVKFSTMMQFRADDKSLQRPVKRL
eukprot:SRR837773.7019.p3 GENE.SRR837773.7019~~SRR837773.7019.p3  ORF type:complete len:154 (-),score=94.64 SRR837773.7019:77-478(-)